MKLIVSWWNTWAAIPPLGHLHHKAKGIRRIIFQKHYNVYYTIRNQTVFVLFIFDRRMDINQRIETDGLDLDLHTSQ